MRNSTIYHNIPKTFRRSSRSILGKWGGNLQNIEKGLREVYIPDGYNESLKARCKYYLETGDTSVFTEEELLTLRIFLQVDQSGAEALIVAYDSDAGDYRQLFINGVKPHVYVAMKLFKDIWKEKAREHNTVVTGADVITLCDTKIPDLKKNAAWKTLDNLIKMSDDWSYDQRYYYFAKQTVHSGNYDIQAPMFRSNVLEKSGGKVVLSPEDSVYFLQCYRGLFPEIPERNERVRRQVDKTKMLFNLFGFPYTITNYNITEATYKEYYAWGPQSTVGEITRIAFTNLQTYIEEAHKQWDILADTHDSYLVQCPLLDVKECMSKMQECMNQELISPIDGVKFNMRSECKCGFNWGSYKKEKNELGLRELQWI